MLNQDQKKAASVSHNRVLVLAGPGTGKTTTLISRYEHLISEGVKPEEIICCTFSRKAADEIKDRIKEKNNSELKNNPIGTFHSLANKSLRELADTISIKVPKDYLTFDKERRSIVEKLKKDNPDIIKKLKYSEQISSKILAYIDEVRERLVDPEDAHIEATELDSNLLISYSQIYKLYENYLSENELIDYPRMIHYAYKVFSHDANNNQNYISRFKHILIDEYQDINFSQKAMIDEILKGGADLWAVGDDDQAIYGWRGSNVKFILDFEINYPGTQKIILKTNYRSENEIVETSNNLAKHFLQRHEKNIISFGDGKGVVKFFENKNENDESQRISKLVKSQKNNHNYKDIAILARTNNLSQDLIEQLLDEDIPFILKNGIDFFNDPSAYDLLTASAISGSIKLESKWNKKIQPKLYGFAKKLIEEDVWKKKVRSLTTFIINNLPSSLSDEDLEEKVYAIEHCFKYLTKNTSAKDAFDKLRKIFSTDTKKDAVHIGTIHGAKGLEWETVIIMGFENDKLPHSLTEGEQAFEEERRVAYVGITRPKTNLFITWSKERNKKEKGPSPYIAEMKSDNISNMIRIEKERRQSHIIQISENIADGSGQGLGWHIQDTGNGLLLEVGYTAKKNGPNSFQRQQILADVFHGRIEMPEVIKESIAKTWSEPDTAERLRKMRNTINTALGSQKGKSNGSSQAISKWEEDIHFIDNILKKELNS